MRCPSSALNGAWEFIAGLGGAVAWLGIGSLIARAQRASVRRIGFSWGFAEIDPDQQLIRPAFEQELAKSARTGIALIYGVRTPR
jgi:hypothetical protein